MTERIASGEIHVEVDDREALASLRRIDSEFDRTMARIDREEAEVDLSANVDHLRRDLKEAERAVKEYERRADAADNNRSKAQLERQKKLKEAEAERARASLSAAQQRQAASKRENTELALTEKRLAAISKRDEQRERTLAAAERRRQQAARAEQRDIEQAGRLRERVVRQQEREEQARQRELAQIPKMRREYAMLADRVEKLNQTRRRVKRDERARLTVDLQIDEAVAKMKALNSTLERVGSPVDLDVDLHPGRDFGLTMRRTVSDAFKRGGVRSAARDAGMLAGVAFSAGVADVARRNLSPQKLLGGLAGIGGRVIHSLSNLSDMTVRLGPFTASIRQAVVATSLFAPIILDLVGALGSLVSVAGSAALGVGALAGGFLGGAIPAALGMGLVIKDVVQQFQAAKKAQKAYDDAVLKNGKNSDQAQKKMKELRHVLGGVSEKTAKQVASAQDLGKAWDKATRPAHASVWKAVGEGIQTANHLMPMFARNTNQAMDVAEKGVSRWMKALRSPEGGAIIDNMMGNFNQSLGPILNGLGNVAAYLGRVSSIASNSIPGIAREFEAWSERLLDTSDNAASLTDRVNETIQSAKDVGRFFMAAGRLAKTFFSGGVDSGQSFVNTMTNAMNRWTAFLSTTEGQQGLHQFFSEAVSGAQALWGTLGPLVTSFVRWAADIAPFARAFFTGSAAVSHFVAEILRLTGLRTPLAALATTLGFLWGVGKISAATQAIVNFTRSLVGLQAVERGVAAGGAVRGVESAVGGLGATARAPIATRQYSQAIGPVTRLGETAKIAESRFAGLKRGVAQASFALTGLSPVALAGVAAVGLLAWGIWKLSTRTKDYVQEQHAAAEGYKRMHAGMAALPGLQNQLAGAGLQEKQAHLDVAAAQKEVNRLRKSGKTHTDEYRQAVLSLRGAQLNEKTSHEQLASTLKSEAKARADLAVGANRNVAHMRRSINDLRDDQAGLDKEFKGKSLGEAYDNVARKAKEAGVNVKDFIKSQGYTERSEKGLLRLAGAYDGLGRATDRQRRMAELANLAQLNQQRAIQGLIPISQQAAAAFMTLSRRMPKLSQKISLKFDDPGQAARVASSASRALKSGVPARVVTKIVADSKSATDAIRKINAISLKTKTLKILEQGGQPTLNRIRAIVGTKLAPKVQHIMASDSSARSKIAQLKALGIPAKIARILGNNSDAIAKARQANAQSLRTLVQIIRRTIQNPANLFSNPTGVTQTINRIIRETKKKASGGRPEGRDHNALIGEGRGPEWRVDTATGRGYKTSGPETVRLGGTEAIIPTEPKWKHRGRAILASVRSRLNPDMLASIADDLGMESFAKGRKHKLTATQVRDRRRNAAKKQARREVKRDRKSTGHAAIQGRLDDVDNAKTRESNAEREVSIFESQMTEPDTFIKEVGQTAEGDPIYAIDQDKINAWVKTLNDMAALQDKVTRAVQDVIDKVAAALATIRSVEKNSQSNIDRLKGAIGHEDGIIKGAGTAAEKDSARERRKVLNDALTEEEGILKDTRDSKKDMNAENNDAGFRKREAEIAAGKTRADAAAVGGNAQADADRSNPKPPKAPDQMTPLEAAQNTLTGLDAEQSLAAIGQGLQGGAPRPAQDITSDIVKAQQSIIDVSRGMLTDADPSNDASAYSAMSQAAQAIQGLTGSGSAAAMAGQYMALGQARGDMYRTFGSNYGSVASSGAAGSYLSRMLSTGQGPMGVNAAGQFGGGPTQVYLGPINFQQQPSDPHLWSRQVAFELQAAL